MNGADVDTTQPPTQALLDAMPDPAVVLDVDGRIRQANAASRQLLRRAWSDLEGHVLTQFLTATDRPAATREVQRAVAGEPGAVQECRLALHTTERLVSWQTRPYAGGCLVLLRTLNGGTVLSRVPRRTRRADRSALSLVLEGLPVGIVLADASGRPHDVNRMARALLGPLVHEPLDRWPTAGVLVGADGESLGVRDVPRFLPDERTQARTTMDLEVRRAGHEPRAIRLHLRPLRDTSGHVREIHAVIEDAQEHASLRRQLHRAQRLEAIGLFAGGIAHDFNNILCAITGYAQLGSSDGSSRDDQRILFQHVQKAGTRGTRLTQQLLAFARMDPGDPEILRIDDAVGDLGEMLERLVGEHIEIRLSLADGGAPIRVPKGTIEQIVLNLAVNAGEAMPGGGRLRIHTRPVSLPEHEGVGEHLLEPGRYVLLTVSDAGAGMDPETCARVFEPFFTTKGAQHGTGLGLSTVHDIVTRSRGAITVDSEPGVGTTFRVYLPCVHAPVQAPTVERLPRIEADDEGHTILLCEDEPMVRSLTAEILERAGHHVLVASHGREALGLAMEQGDAVDLLVTDVVMPEMGGVELAQRLRAERPDLRVLYLSGYPADSLEAVSNARGRSAFLAKPYNAHTLGDQVRALLAT